MRKLVRRKFKAALAALAFLSLAAGAAGALTVAAGLPAAFAAEAELSGADRAAIERTIRGQIEAFGRDDAAAAFAFAAPAIREMFGTPENFLGMVRNGYAAVYRPREVEFRALVTVAEIVVQQVLVVGPDGRAQIALYTMERQADGTWRINGCSLVASPEKAI
ncbi:DUF4864 domain-containing protein [Desertibaculum subflavum]|uniref:DUF4864 domain-containing protein n=1 Tax=Desertibaculum subflavum TaxID=2268458 RepID=UPI000E663124